MAFIRCGTHSHWGRWGAAGLALTTYDGATVRLLMQRRSRHVLHPGTWALPGGALERGESATDGALRETHEEVGLDLSQVTVTGTMDGLVHPKWRYTYVLASTPEIALPDHQSWEVAEHRWLTLDEVDRLGNRQPQLADDWPRLRRRLDDHRDPAELG